MTAEKNYWAAILGITSLIAALAKLIRGKVWDLHLLYERILVSVVLFAFAAYCLKLA